MRAGLFSAAVSAAILLAACGGRAAPRSAPGPAAAAPAPALVAPAPPLPAPPALFAALNLGFEEVEAGRPRAWKMREGADVAADEREKHGGARALRLRVTSGEYLSASVTHDVKAFAGKRLRLRGWIKTADAPEGAGLWLRIDTAADTGAALDNTFERRVTGTAPWTEVAAAVDVPANAETLVAGAMLFGAGTAWFDDLSLEVTEITPPPAIAIEGTVVDPAGAPAAGAEVALIGRGFEVAQHVHADARGRFRFDTTAGKWGVSAHRAGGVGVFVAPRRFDASGEVSLALGKDGGVTVRGRTTAKPAPGAYVEISRVGAFDTELFAVPLAADGRFEAVLPRADKYYVSLLGGIGNGTFDRKGDRVDAVLEIPSPDPPPAAVVAYIAERGIPLATAEPGRGIDDLAPIGKLVGGARIVALGEATHGTREFFQLKHRFVEYLVAKQGFTVFAIEANQPECRAINEYVLHGKGNARAALEGIYFWTWNTEEVLALIEWMRAWNADPAHAQKVQFTGVDMQASHVAHAGVAAFLGKVAPAEVAGYLAPLALLADERAMGSVGKAPAEVRGRLTAGLAALGEAFDANRKAWTASGGGPAAYAEARHDLTILAQATAMYVAGDGIYEVRDRAMADNVGWLLDQTKAKIIVWAHNGHISNALPTFTTMGHHLRRRYGRAYVNFGFLFGEGSFQAIDSRTSSRAPVEVTLGPPPVSNASVAFSRAGEPLLVLDLRALPARGPVRAWFDAPRPVRDTGGSFAGEYAMTYMTVLPRSYDAVIFVDKTTRARSLRAKPAGR